MGRRNLSPILRELQNLDKDSDSRKSAMKALKSYVKDLDSKAIPLFLAQVSETKDSSSSSVEHTISLYEVLARVHGPKIFPHIDNIMSTIIKTLTSSAGSFPLQQACSKVVPAIARYAIDPSTTEDMKRMVIYSLCKPLSDSLLGSQETLGFGAALCLEALVDSDNWRFASDALVNEVCLRVAGALEEKPTQTNSHMGLAMALGKHNSFTVEAYAGSLIRSGLQILNAGAVEGNSQKQLSAIQMVNFLMKCVDPRSIYLEIEAVIEEMEKCDSNQMAFVRGAAFEALQTARMIAAEKGSRLEREPASVTGSNFGRRKDYNRRKNSWAGSDKSLVSTSPESQTVYSFVEYDTSAESPMSTRQSSCNFNGNGRSVNRKLWRNENGRVDISLKDGIHSNIRGSNGFRTFSESFKNGRSSENGGSEVFSGFVHATPRNGATRSATSSPERSHARFNNDDIRIITSPRKLMCSLQDLTNVNSVFNAKQPRSIRSSVSNKSEWNPRRKLDGNNLNDDYNESENSENREEEPPRKLNENNLNDDYNESENSKNGEEEPYDSESVSSTCNVAADGKPEVSHEVSHEPGTAVQILSIKRKSFIKAVRNLVFGLCFALCAVILSIMFIEDQDSSVVPT